MRYLVFKINIILKNLCGWSMGCRGDQTSIPQLFFPSAVLWGKWKWWWGKIVFCCSPNPRSAGLVRSAGLAISPLSVPTHFTDRSYPFVNLSSAISICTNVASETFKHFLQQLTCLAVKGLTLFMDVLVSFIFFARGEKYTLHFLFIYFFARVHHIANILYPCQPISYDRATG